MTPTLLLAFTLLFSSGRVSSSLCCPGGTHAGMAGQSFSRRASAPPTVGSMHLLCTTGPFPVDLSSKRQGSPVNKRVLVNLTTTSDYSSRPLTKALLVTTSQNFSHPILVDSGADESFKDWGLARILGLDWSPLPKALEANVLDGCLLCRVTQSLNPSSLSLLVRTLFPIGL